MDQVHRLGKRPLLFEKDQYNTRVLTRNHSNGTDLVKHFRYAKWVKSGFIVRLISLLHSGRFQHKRVA